MKLHNKVVIVTGATSGIGESCAKIFGKEGAKIAITGRNQLKLDNTLVLLQKEGIDCIGILAEAGKEDHNLQMAEQVKKYFGRIDILINNAGITMRALFQDLDLEVFRKVMDTNFWGSVYATKYCLPEIINTQGSIIAVSSI